MNAIDGPNSVVRRFTLIGGLLGVSFGYWIAIWSSNYWPLVTGGKAIASWIPYTIIGFEVMVLVGALSTVGRHVHQLAHSPVSPSTVGYDDRFSSWALRCLHRLLMPTRRRRRKIFLRHCRR
ncbi:quinol:electron acceptor oxidoreductase subunit ActD [Gemmatimonas sp.]|uniref:quinol:electron acceptor oxidoreductase subunit ActD n=1 Tax=Gemmatimonas sp. TaxID=1962908 RepID=UPI003DA40C63